MSTRTEIYPRLGEGTSDFIEPLLVKGRIIKFHAFGDKFEACVISVHRKQGIYPIVSFSMFLIKGTAIQSNRKAGLLWRDFKHFKKEYDMGMWTFIDTIIPLELKLSKLLYYDQKR